MKNFALAMAVPILIIVMAAATEPLKSKLPSRQITLQEQVILLTERVENLEKLVKTPSQKAPTTRPKVTAKSSEPKELTTSRSFCISCHRSDSSAEKGDDLTIFGVDGKPVLRETRDIELCIKKVEGGEMPKRSAKQPTDAERQEILKWLQSLKAGE